MDRGKSTPTTTMVNKNSHFKATQFLNKEAELINDNKWREWLEEMVAEEINYTIPVRTTREMGEEVDEFSNDAYHMLEDYNTFQDRIERFEEDHAWSHNPRPRRRHIVSNVRVHNESDEVLDVKSNFIIYRNQGEPSRDALLSGEREDKLVAHDGNKYELQLAKRVVKLDQTDLNTRDLGHLI